MWKKLGKEGLAIKAPWPVADEEDKLLTRQGKFLRDSLKKFRGLAGKAKKGLKAASIVVTDSYPQWKVDTLKWMQEQHSAETGFSKSFMKDLKTWTGQNVSDKKMIKFTMQFSSFMKSEVEEVGKVAMDIHLPFDQVAILEASMKYIKAQLQIEELDILKLENAEGVPERIADQVIPAKPYLWLR
jgi:leucyl-tRNA synthetase